MTDYERGRLAGFAEGVEAAAGLVRRWHISKGGYGILEEAIRSLAPPPLAPRTGRDSAEEILRYAVREFFRIEGADGSGMYDAMKDGRVFFGYPPPAPRTDAPAHTLACLTTFVDSADPECPCQAPSPKEDTPECNCNACASRREVRGATEDAPRCEACGHPEDAHNSAIANGCCHGEWERCGCFRFVSGTGRSTTGGGR